MPRRRDRGGPRLPGPLPEEGQGSPVGPAPQRRAGRAARRHDARARRPAADVRAPPHGHRARAGAGAQRWGWSSSRRGRRRRVTEVLGPWLALGIGVLLIGGTALAALLVFRPAHVQLSALEQAARRFGAGELDRPRPAGGGDEVAAVAQAFNRMADDLTRAPAELAEADRSRRQLLADVSHELMTPLTAIRGYAETLTLPQFGPRRRRTASATCGSSRKKWTRIERLVGDLLDLARYDAGGVTLVREEVADRRAFRSRRRPPRTGGAREAGDASKCGCPTRRWRSAATRGASSRRCRTWRRTRCATRPPADASRSSAAQRDGRTRLRVADTGAGHRRRAPAAHLRSLLQGRSVAQRNRIGARAVDRQGHRRAPRRRGDGGKRSGTDRVRDRSAEWRCVRSVDLLIW